MVVYLNGKYLVYFAGLKKHISVYPATISAVEKAGLSKYKVSKGTLRFSFDKSFPYDLIVKFVKERLCAVITYSEKTFIEQQIAVVFQACKLNTSVTKYFFS